MKHPGPKPRWTPTDIAEREIIVGCYKIMKYDGYERKTEKNGYHWYLCQCKSCGRTLRRAQASIARAAADGCTHCAECKNEGKDKLTDNARRAEKERLEREGNLAMLQIFRDWPISSDSKPFDSRKTL